MYSTLLEYPWPKLQILVDAVNKVVREEERTTKNGGSPDNEGMPTYRDIMDRMREFG